MKFPIAIMTILGMLLTTTAQAQTRQPATNQTVTTDDGRKVILKSNGTWQYADKKATSTKGKGILSFETGLVLNSGDIKPVSRTTFYLLDKSFAQTLIDASFQDADGNIIKKPRDIYGEFLMSDKYKILGKNLDLYNRAWLLIKPHVVQTVITGFDGKATFKPMQAGKYFLMGYSEVSRNLVFWDVEVNLSSGDNLLTLDQNNAGFP